MMVAFSASLSARSFPFITRTHKRHYQWMNRFTFATKYKPFANGHGTISEQLGSSSLLSSRLDTGSVPCILTYCQPHRAISRWRKTLKTLYQFQTQVKSLFTFADTIKPTANNTMSKSMKSISEHYILHFAYLQLAEIYIYIKCCKCFLAYLYSVDSQHGNLHQSLVSMSRVTCFTPRAHAGTCESHTNARS